MVPPQQLATDGCTRYSGAYIGASHQLRACSAVTVFIAAAAALAWPDGQGGAYTRQQCGSIADPTTDFGADELLPCISVAMQDAT